MIQKIYIILFAFRSVDESISFPDYIKSRIDSDIRSFLPIGTDFIDFNTYSDFFADLVIEKINGIHDDEYYAEQEVITDKKIMEFTFSSDEELKFQLLPWLEGFINFMVGEYNSIGVIFPYIIKTNNQYTFRIPYRVITSRSDDDSESDPMEGNIVELQENARFFKNHFYNEEIPNDCYSGMAKIMLLVNMVSE